MSLSAFNYSFYERDTVIVARDLLGKKIIRVMNGTVLSGIIIETEAYCAESDLASHAYRGKTKRNWAMFGPVGHAYVYFIYGVHFCVNIVARKRGVCAGAVLIRALVINFNLGVSKNISNKSWIYFPEKEYPFYRIGFPHTFSETMAPKGCSSLYGECSYLANSLSPTQRDNLCSRAITSAQKLFSINNNDIVTKNLLHIAHAYVIYDTWRDTYLSRLLARLEEHDIYSVGRYGAWKYSSMQEAVLDGKTIAQQFTDIPEHHTLSSYKPSHKHRHI